MAELGLVYALVYAPQPGRNTGQWFDALLIDEVKQNGDFGGSIYEGEERGTPLHVVAGHYDNTRGLITFHDLVAAKQGPPLTTISFSGTVITNNDQVRGMFGTFHELTFHSVPEPGWHGTGDMRIGPWVGVGGGEEGIFFGL